MSKEGAMEYQRTKPTFI